MVHTATLPGSDHGNREEGDSSPSAETEDFCFVSPDREDLEDTIGMFGSGKPEPYLGGLSVTVEETGLNLKGDWQKRRFANGTSQACSGDLPASESGGRIIELK